MTGLLWLRGLLRHRPGRIASTALGVALGVALLASIGTFLSSTTSKMTQRAAARVPVDWQVQAAPNARPAAVLAQVKAFPGVKLALPVQFAPTPGLQATTGGSVQRTGPGRVLGLPDGYSQAFPGAVRALSGSDHGVLVAQQTAANLHVRVGDTVRVGLPNGASSPVRVDGIVDLPAIDSLFQQVGAPPGAQAHAPPDNVILLPPSVFARVEGPAGGAGIATQIHVDLGTKLPGSPSAAFDAVSGQARNLETRLAGAGLVGDNLGSALDKARADALYAQVLFLFMGVPGAILAALIAASVSAAGAGRRRRDSSLLRARGASTATLVRVAMGEAAVAGVLGVLLGLAAALLVGKSTFGTASFGAGTTAAVLWASGAALTGLVIAALAIALPAWRDARALTVAGQRRQVGRRDRAPWWARYGLDFAALAGAGLVYWQASKNGYKLVLAPEGVPQVSVNWYALLAPVLTWLGGGLLAYRLVDLILVRGRTPLAGLLRPLAGRLAPIVAATMGRERRMLARGVTLLALTAAFAGSTAIFNSTYQQQAEVDARLTNGADVVATQSPGAPVGPQGAKRLERIPGVGSVEPLQHRFAYVGADLQDLYGVRPSTIGAAGKLQDAWFQGGSASALMAKLAAHPDSLLVSAETVKDFQLRSGDHIKLRLQDGRTKQFKTVPFHYVGVGKEFPTAPVDSFLIANADYVARMTGSNAVGSFLIQTKGASPGAVAGRVRSALGTSAKVSDISSSRRVVGSNLTAVELSGLTKVELGFALILAIAASGLVLALGFRERRRNYAIAAALGARSRQLGGFVWGESAFVTGGGLILGSALAAGLSAMLVKVLTGVFDPPPDVLGIPWGYLATVIGLALAAVALAGAVTLRALRRPAIEDLRDL